MSNSQVIALITSSIQLVLCFYLFVRNWETKKFVDLVARMCYDWDVAHVSEIVDGKEQSAYAWYYTKLPHYYTIALGFKPIRLASFLPDTVIEKLNT